MDSFTSQLKCAYCWFTVGVSPLSGTAYRNTASFFRLNLQAHSVPHTVFSTYRQSGELFHCKL